MQQHGEAQKHYAKWNKPVSNSEIQLLPFLWLSVESITVGTEKTNF